MLTSCWCQTPSAYHLGPIIVLCWAAPPLRVWPGFPLMGGPGCLLFGKACFEYNDFHMDHGFMGRYVAEDLEVTREGGKEVLCWKTAEMTTSSPAPSPAVVSRAQLCQGRGAPWYPIEALQPSPAALKWLPLESIFPGLPCGQSRMERL